MEFVYSNICSLFSYKTTNKQEKKKQVNSLEDQY